MNTPTIDALMNHKETLIRLKNQEPLNGGATRLVFSHPHEPNWIIKVIRPDIIEKRYGEKASRFRFKRRRRAGKYNSFDREVREYFVGYAEIGTAPPFVQEIVGFCHTDMGLGLISCAIKRKDGSLAFSINELIKRRQYTHEMSVLLEEIECELLNSKMIFSDLNLGAIVHDEKNNRFVMVDGLGVTNPIPIKAMSCRLNRRSKKKKFSKLRRKIDHLKAEHNYL